MRMTQICLKYITAVIYIINIGLNLILFDMKKKIRNFLFVAVTAVAGYNVYASQTVSGYSDVVLANVEALADTSEEFTNATCCKAVLVKKTCDGCDGKRHSYAEKV